jgi:hypothetical protein
MQAWVSGCVTFRPDDYTKGVGGFLERNQWVYGRLSVGPFQVFFQSRPGGPIHYLPCGFLAQPTRSCL